LSKTGEIWKHWAVLGIVLSVLLCAPAAATEGAATSSEVGPVAEQHSEGSSSGDATSSGWPASAGPPPSGLNGAIGSRQWDPRRDPEWVGRDRRLSAGLYVFAAWLGVFGGGLLISAIATRTGNADGTSTMIRLGTFGGLAAVGVIGTIGFGSARYSHRRPLRSVQTELTAGGFVVWF
jgi:hypothetical protein